MAISFSESLDYYEEELFVKRSDKNIITVLYKPYEKQIKSFDLSEEIQKRAKQKRKLIEIDEDNNSVTIYPLNTLITNNNYLLKKYQKIIKITLHGFGIDSPNSSGDVLRLLEEFPTGFIKTYTYGLGLVKNLRFIIHSIEKLEVEHLIISKYVDTKIEENSYTLSYKDFEAIRKGINRITRNYQTKAMVEKSVFSYNALLNQLEPEKYPEKFIPYKKGSIIKFISNHDLLHNELSTSDTGIVTDLISENTKEIFNKNKNKLMELERNIDLVTLEWLVKEIDHLLNKKSSEHEWQKLLTENPIILSLVFGFPIIKIQEQASVGGKKISGKGEKITDFLVKNNLTNNLAIVEIKKPSTRLLGNIEYRGGVYTPSNELSGAINQLLDQKYQLQKQISQLKDNSGIYDIESYSINCLLIISEIPTDPDKVKSFELYRNNSKDISIYTFNELGCKLKEVYNLLRKGA